MVTFVRIDIDGCADHVNKKTYLVIKKRINYFRKYHLKDI